MSLHVRSQKIMRGGGGGRVAKRRRREPARGGPGMLPRKIFENLMQNGAFWGNLEKKIQFNSAYWFRTPSLIVLVAFQGGGGRPNPSNPPPPPGYGYALIPLVPLHMSHYKLREIWVYYRNLFEYTEYSIQFIYLRHTSHQVLYKT